MATVSIDQASCMWRDLMAVRVCVRMIKMMVITLLAPGKVYRGLPVHTQAVVMLTVLHTEAVMMLTLPVLATGNV